MKSLTKSGIIWKYKNLCRDKYVKDTHILVSDHCHYILEYRGVALTYSLPKKIPIAFHNGSNYDYQFIIKELAEAFEKQFTCLGESTGKYITFTVSIKKEVTRTDEDGEKIIKIYILQITIY